MFELQRKSANSSVQLKLLSSIHSSDVKNRSIVDIAYAFTPNIFLANDCGAVFHCIMAGNNNVMSASPTERSWMTFLILTIFRTQIVTSDPTDAHKFWRIKCRKRDNILVLASEKSVRLYDLKVWFQPHLYFFISIVAQQSNQLSTKIFSPSEGSEYITSISTPQSNHQLCVSTTSEVVWVDDRNTKRPVLAWRHHRNFDRTLTTQTVDVDNGSYTITPHTYHDLEIR